MIDPPKRTGYRLTYDAECLYNDWQEVGGCSCHTGCAPCSSCHNEGHPVSLEENDEAWELDYTIADVYNAWKLKQEVEMSRSCITDKGGSDEWGEVLPTNLNSLIVGQEVKINEVQTRITKLDMSLDKTNVIGFFTARDISVGGNPNNFWGKHSHSDTKVWVKGNTQPKPQFKAGDKVRIVSNGNNHKQPVGSVVTLCEAHNPLMISAEYSHLGKAWGIKENSLITVRESDLELVVETEKVFKVGKWYKCVEGSPSNGLQLNNYYELLNGSTVSEGLRFKGECDGCYWSKSRFDISSESDYDPNAKKVVAKDVEESKLDNIVQVTITRSTDTNNFMSSFLTTKEDINIMSNQNRVVSVKFFDDDAGLKAEHSLVAEYQVTTRVSDQMTISKVLLTEDVAGDIELHNGIRANTVDLHILKQTGNKVMLQPVEFEDLRVEVRQV